MTFEEQKRALSGSQWRIIFEPHSETFDVVDVKHKLLVDIGFATFWEAFDWIRDTFLKPKTQGGW